jgi:flavodoxin
MNAKLLAIYNSVHHGNTEKIAKAMMDVLEAKLVKPQEVDVNTVVEYDLVGFGSGIYAGKHHKSILKLVDRIPFQKNKKSFIFSTSGMKEGGIFNRFNKPLKEKLSEKGFRIIGEFSCRGYDTFGPFKIIGGIRKDRPNKKDIEQARNFAQSLLEKLSEAYKIQKEVNK